MTTVRSPSVRVDRDRSTRFSFSGTDDQAYVEQALSGASSAVPDVTMI